MTNQITNLLYKWDQQVQGKSSFLFHKLTVPYLVKKITFSNITEPKSVGLITVFIKASTRFLYEATLSRAHSSPFLSDTF